MNPITAMERFRDAIVDAGVRAVLDARDVNPPAVLIRPPTLTYRFGRGCIGANWSAWVYVPDPGQIDALRIAVPILDKTYGALASVGVAVLQAEPTDFALPDGGTASGYILTWNTSQ